MALILVIEDAALSRQMLRKILQPEGHTILEAKNGREGLEMASTHNPDCILLDILMPEMGGREVLKALRLQDSQIPTIVITADIQESTRQECLELGAFAVLHKLIKPNELRQWIEKALEFSSQEGIYEPNT